MGLLAQRVAQGQAEGVAGDLEQIARPGGDPVGEGQRGGAKEMHMHVARLAEQRIFEMVMFQIGETRSMFASPDRKGFGQITAPS